MAKNWQGGVAMKIIGDKSTNNIFENIKHIDEYGNEYWYARELSKNFRI